MAEANGEMLLNVTEKDIFEGRKATTGGSQTTWFDPANLTPNNSIKNSIAFIRDSCDIWAKNKYYQAIPTDNGKVGQVLVCDANGRGKWGDLSMEDYYSYGVEWDINTHFANMTLIGNKKLQDEKPVHNSFQPCIYNTTNNAVKYWLKSTELNTNNKYDTIDGEETVIGSNEELMIHIPTFYGYYNYDSGNQKLQVRVSRYRLSYKWFEIPEMYLAANWNTSNTPPSTNSNLITFKYYTWIFYWCRIIDGAYPELTREAGSLIPTGTQGQYRWQSNANSITVPLKWRNFEIIFPRYSSDSGVQNDTSLAYEVVNDLRVTRDDNSNKSTYTYDGGSYIIQRPYEEYESAQGFRRLIGDINSENKVITPDGNIIKNSKDIVSETFDFRLKGSGNNAQCELGIYITPGRMSSSSFTFFIQGTGSAYGNHRYYILAN